MSEAKCKFSNEIASCKKVPYGDYCPRHAMLVALHSLEKALLLEYGAWCMACDRIRDGEGIDFCMACGTPVVCAECRAKRICCEEVQAMQEAEKVIAAYKHKHAGEPVA